MSAHSAQKSIPKPLDSASQTMSANEESQDDNSLITPRTGNEILRDAITDLYLDVKIRSSEEIDQYDTNQFQKERDRLNSLSLVTIVEYIKSSIEILMNMKLDESEQKTTSKYRPSSRPYFKREDKASVNELELGKNKTSDPKKEIDLDPSKIKLEDTNKSILTDYEPPKEYEKVIQKLEADVRNHIRVEQQLKLHIETVHNKMEELENKCNTLQNENDSITAKKDIQINELEDKVKERIEKIKELEETIKLEQEKHTEKFEKLETRIFEMEKSHQKEMSYMQKEI